MKIIKSFFDIYLLNYLGPWYVEVNIQESILSFHWVGSKE